VKAGQGIVKTMDELQEMAEDGVSKHKNFA
jgi:hypothetical protein